ncbi:uncharacterized protein [Diadema setosum]|uniref:uncharacterized protein n=1 Tax=Diadema setosum TaxID=31175 RepID=UPI003B3B34B2
MDTEQPKLGVYRCPVFLNQSRQVCAFTLDLACPLPVEQWTMSGAALILDPEAPENETRKWPQPSMPPSTRTLEETKASIANEEGGSERGPPSQASRRSLGSKPGSATGLRISSGSRHSAVSRPTNSRQSVRSEKRVTIEEVEEEEEKPKQPLKQEPVAEEMEDGTGGDGTGKIDEEEEEAAELLLTARSMEIERKRHLKSTFDYRNLAGALNDNQNAYPDEEDEEEVNNENANNDAGDEGDYDDGFEAASERSSTRSSHHSDSRASSASLQNGDDRKDVDEDEDVRKEKEADNEGNEDYDKESRKSAQSRQSVQSRHSAKSHHSVKSHHSAESHGSAQSRQSHVNGKASPTESDRNSPYATGSKATDNIKEGKSPMGSRTSLQSKKLSQKSKDEDTASKKSFKAAEGIYGSDKGSKRGGSGASTRSRTKPEPDKDRASSAESSRSNGKASPSGKESKDLVPRPPSDAGSRKSGRPGSSGSRRSVRSASSVKSKKESDDDKGKERTSSDDSEHRSGSPGSSPKGDKKDHHGSKESLNFFEQAIATITGQDSDDESSKKRAEEAKSAASHGRQSSQGQESSQERESRQGRRSGQLTISQASGSIFNKDDPAY